MIDILKLRFFIFLKTANNFGKRLFSYWHNLSTTISLCQYLYCM